MSGERRSLPPAGVPLTGRQRGALARCLVFALCATAVAAAWENFAGSGDARVTGEVVRVERVFGGKGGDNRAFTIRYEMDDSVHRITTSRGLLDYFGGMRDLSEGDELPLRVDSRQPGEAVPDTLNARFPITLCCGALVGIVAMTWGVLELRSRFGRGI